LLVAGEDPEANAIVMGLVETTGFDPVDGGTLSESWRQQPGVAGYCADLSKDARW
jgi:8-hydroxy-5-deazaflavin:NADPH oxidoreductase